MLCEKNSPTKRTRLCWCRACRVAYYRDWYSKHPGYRKRMNIERYGLTVEAFVALCEAQGDACAICRKAFGTARENRPVIDHDHETRKVRGALCHSCNSGLGMFGDSPERVAAAREYLLKHGH